MIIVETTASLILSGISAAMQSIQTWMLYRDRGKAAEAFKKEYTESKVNPQLLKEAQQLEEGVSKELLSIINKRLNRCWKAWLEILDANPDLYTDIQIDDSTLKFKQCCCKELNRLLEVGEQFTEEHQEKWKIFECEKYNFKSL